METSARAASIAAAAAELGAKGVGNSVVGLCLIAFVIYDVVAESYMPPFFARTVGEGLRQFQEILSDERSAMSKRIADYRLFRSGTFDVSSGILRGLPEGMVLVEEG